jgi:hypothetical protein
MISHLEGKKLRVCAGRGREQNRSTSRLHGVVDAAEAAAN